MYPQTLQFVIYNYIILYTILIYSSIYILYYIILYLIYVLSTFKKEKGQKEKTTLSINYIF